MSDIGDPILSLNGELYPNCIWVDKAGVTLNPSSYPKLFEKYGTKYGGDGVTTFGLPDFSDCAIWGNETPGQRLNAALPNITGGFTADGRNAEPYGAFYLRSNNTGDDGSGNGGNYAFDASRSSSVYQNGVTTVYPNRMTVRVMTRYK